MAVLIQNLNRALFCLILTPGNKISFLGSYQKALTRCCNDPLRPPRFSGLGLRGRCYRRPHWIHFLAEGTFCFNSSNQFSTTMICVGGCPGSTGCIARNR